MSRVAVASVFAALLGGWALGCGGDGESSGGDLGPAEVRANLEAEGYAVGEDVTEGANLALPPDGEIDAEVYFGVESGPEQEPGLTAGVYFFSDPADAQAVADAFSDSLHEVRDTRLYNLGGGDEEVLNSLVEAGEGS